MRQGDAADEPAKEAAVEAVEEAVEEAAFFSDLLERQRRAWPVGLWREPCYPLGERALTDYLRHWARHYPDRIAIDFHGATLRYADLDRLSDACARMLAAAGVETGDRVAVMMGNCPQFHIAFYGILKLGAVHVPVNPMFTAEELVYELSDAGARAAIAFDPHAAAILAVRERTGLATVFSTGAGDCLDAAAIEPLPAELKRPRQLPPLAIDLFPALWRELDNVTEPGEAGRDLDALAALNYTGGTTGLPKGCMHTQRDMVYTAASTYATSGSAPMPADSTAAVPSDEVILCYLPMFWIAGENLGLIYPVFTGATLVLLARWDPLAFMAGVARRRVTRSFLVVDNLVEVLGHPQREQYALRSLVSTRVASFVRKITPDLREAWRDLTGGIAHEGAWGMTETHTSDTFTTGMQRDDFDLAGRPVFVGLPAPGTRIKICDFETGAVLPIGREGEIVVSTPSLFKGYWQQRPADAGGPEQGWFRSGDIGVFDEGGYLHYLGRRKEMLKVRGMSVFPAELEVTLARHEAVLGCAVLGRPDARRGQVPVAWVLLRPGFDGQVDAAVLQAWCLERLAAYKLPEIRIEQSLPMTATGKVRKVELQARLDAENKGAASGGR